MVREGGRARRVLRRLVVAGAAMAVVGFGLKVVWSPDVPEDVGSSSAAAIPRRVAVPLQGDDRREELEALDSTEPTSHPERWRARVDAVTASCGLAIDTVCRDGRCVAISVGPDLDRLEGWVTLVATSPRFVLSTALRDLGVPGGLMPCGGAIAALTQSGSVPAVELPDGTEVWCAAEQEDREALALCDVAATERVGAAVAGFQRQDVRRLTFSRDR